MSNFVEWIAAEAEGWDPAKGGIVQNGMPVGNQGPQCGAGAMGVELPPYRFTAGADCDEGWPEGDASDRNPDVWMYRNRTVGLLRRYMRFSLETGRLPSIMGREFFRAKVTAYRPVTFEDRVILVRDVEMCLGRLRKWDQELIARVILQEHDQWEAARLLNCGRATVQRRLYEVLDLLSEEFLRVGLLTEAEKTEGAKSCQEAKSVEK